MNRTENVELTVLCLLEEGVRVLLQNRTKADWQGYALPGGHVEPGESVVDAVVREIQEETGLTVIRPRLVGVKQFPIKGGRYLVFLFKAELYEGMLQSSAEGQMEWIPYDQLRKINTVSDLELLLNVMNSSELTEFQYIVDGNQWTARIH